MITAAQAQFAHPGCLSTQTDLDRMAAKVAAGAQPWKGSWDKLVSNTNGWTNHNPEAVATVTAGGGLPENYIRLARDAARAYQLALRFHGDGSTWAANKSIQIMNTWAATHTGWNGDSNVSLRAGIYGYQFACAAELMRGYSGWQPADFTAFKDYMRLQFYARNNDFLTRHHDTRGTHYWANWEHANVASVMAIGVLLDDQTIFDQAIDYFYNGIGNGNMNLAVTRVHPNGLGQWQESGRDQGHSIMGPQLLGAICEIAWNQGHDLYGALNNRFLSSVEYISKYNTWRHVPFGPYVRDYGRLDSPLVREIHLNISSTARGQLRPGWDLVYNHYVNRMGMTAPYTADYAAKTRPEGGGFNFGDSSGGFDGLGFTTLTHSRDPIASSVAPSGLRTTRDPWQITLSWWGSAHATSYNVKRATTSSGPYTTIAQVSAKNLFYVDAGLTAGTTYYYVVSANVPGGETPNSTEESAIAVATGGDSYQSENASYGGGAQLITHTTNHNGTGSVVPQTGGHIEWTGIDGGAGGPTTLAIRYALGGPNRTGIWTVNGVQHDVLTYSTGDWDSWDERLVTVTLNSGTNNTIRITSDGTDAYVYVDELIVKNSTAAPTMAVPPAPGGLSATAVSSTRVDLSWSAVTGAESYYIKRATTSGGPYVILDHQSGTTFSDTGLLDGVTYYYVVTAVNPAGQSVNSAQVSATTANIPQFEESGGLVSMEAENGLVGSRWLTGTDGGASNGAYIEVNPAYDWTGGSPEGTTAEYLASYKVNISTSGNYRFWFRLLSGNAADDSFYWRINGGSWIVENNRYGIGSWFGTDNIHVDGLTPGVHTLDVAYRENGTRLDKFVIQLDSLTAPSGNGPAESPMNVITDTTPPDAPTALVATAGDATVSLDWADNIDPDLASYTVYRSTTSESGFSAIVSGLVSSAYTDNNVANGTTYHYFVTATDSSSNESSGSDGVSAIPQVNAPSAPTGLNAVAVSSSQIDLSWTISGDADSYNVKRSTTSGGPYTVIASATGASFSDTSLSGSTTYYYVLSAVNAGGESSNSSEASATTQAEPDTTPPAAPGGLAATAGDGSVSLDWADNTEPDFASHTVYRSTTSGSGYSAIATGLTTSAYSDSGVTNGTTYYYVVTATDTSSNESANSAEANATPAASSGPVSVKASLPGATFASQAGPTLATSPTFNMAGGNAVALLFTAENSASSDTISATFAGQPMTLGVSTNQDVQWSGIFYLINPATTSGSFEITTSGSSASCAYSAISLVNVGSVADIDAVANTSTGGTISLATITTTDGGYVLGAVVNNGWDASNPPPSFISGDADQVLLNPVLVGSSGHLHTYGDVSLAGTSTNEYGNLVQRNAYVALAFNSNVPDTTSPTVNLTTASSSVTGPFDVTVGFSETVSGLDLADFSVVNGSAGTLSGSGADYTLNVSPTADGTVSVALPADSAQDAAGNGNLASNTLNVTYTAQSTGDIHVESIVVETVNVGGGNKKGRATVTIRDNTGAAVSGAHVIGTFSGSYSETLAATTDANGVALLTTTGTKKGGVSFTFCVDDVVGSLPYDSADNVETCDSL